MAIALGLTPEQEYKEGLSQIAKASSQILRISTNIKQKLRGPLGLFLTSHDPKETQEWFESFQVKEFARMGNRATSEVILPDGESCERCACVKFSCVRSSPMAFAAGNA